MAVVPDRSVLAGLLVVLVVLASGLVGGPPAGLGDGTAEVAVVSPDVDRLAVHDGRFGTATTYLRLPDLVVETSNVSGRPRLVYAVAVPELGLDRQRTRLIEGERRLRIHMPDRAFAPRGTGDGALPPPGTYEGRLTVRVQSFSSDRTVVNRTVAVRVSE